MSPSLPHPSRQLVHLASSFVGEETQKRLSESGRTPEVLLRYKQLFDPGLPCAPTADTDRRQSGSHTPRQIPAEPAFSRVLPGEAELLCRMLKTWGRPGGREDSQHPSYREQRRLVSGGARGVTGPQVPPTLRSASQDHSEHQLRKAPEDSALSFSPGLPKLPHGMRSRPPPRMDTWTHG